jgi:hypothetical protein
VNARRTRAWTPALVAALSLVLTSPAWSRGGAGAPGAQHVKLDPAEVATLGTRHAREHAAVRERKRLARERWERLTSQERRQRLRTAERQEQRLDRALAAQPRDDIGFWGERVIQLPDYAIHASMMPTSELLIFGREPLVNGARLNRGSARIFNPATGQTRHVPPPPIRENPSQ